MSFIKKKLIVLLFFPYLIMASELSTQKMHSAKTVQTLQNDSIVVHADTQFINLSDNTTTFSGKVIAEKQDFVLRADKVIITNLNSNSEQKMMAYGSPVNFKQAMPDPKENIIGYANSAIYDVKNNIVTLDGNAKIVQQGQEIKSDVIYYDITKQTMEAQSPVTERVQTILQPSQIKKRNTE